MTTGIRTDRRENTDMLQLQIHGGARYRNSFSEGCRIDRPLPGNMGFHGEMSRSMDVIPNEYPNDKKSSFQGEQCVKRQNPDANNNTEKQEPFKRKFLCPEIEAIIGQYISPGDIGSLSMSSSLKSNIRRSRSLNELPGSVRVPILKRLETDRIRARLEASIAGTEELNQLRENQERMMEETRSTINQRQVRYQQSRRVSTPTRSSTSSLARICEEDVYDQGSDKEVFYDENLRDRTNFDVPLPRRTQSYREHHKPDVYQSRSRRPLSITDAEFINNDGSGSSLSDPEQSWQMWTQRAESLSDEPPKRSSRSHSVCVGRSKDSAFSSSYLNDRKDISSNNENIEPKLRRASLQCHDVLTGGNNNSSMFENMDIKSKSPNPLHAVLMQYDVAGKRDMPLNRNQPSSKSSHVNANVVKREITRENHVYQLMELANDNSVTNSTPVIHSTNYNRIDASSLSLQETDGASSCRESASIKHINTENVNRTHKYIPPNLSRNLEKSPMIELSSSSMLSISGNTSKQGNIENQTSYYAPCIDENNHNLTTSSNISPSYLNQNTSSEIGSASDVFSFNECDLAEDSRTSNLSPKNFKHNSIASDEGFMTSTPSTCSLLSSSALSANCRDVRRKNNLSIASDEGYIISPPGTPEPRNMHNSFVSKSHSAPSNLKNGETVSIGSLQIPSGGSSKMSDKRVSEIPTQSFKQTAV